MNSRIFSQVKYNGLKMATRRLNKNAGGLESAAYMTRVQHAQLGVYQNINNPDQFMPLDVIADLEHETGDPVVTKALCEIAGGYFTPHHQSDEILNLPLSLAKIGKEFADIMTEAGLALSDNIITKQERAAIAKQIDEAIQALAAAKSSLNISEGSDE